MESLFVEYDYADRGKSLLKDSSSSNVRLVRCSGNKCAVAKAAAQVADKYIEFELLLVLIDVILHRLPAFRHLLFNRFSSSSLKVSLIIYVE